MNFNILTFLFLIFFSIPLYAQKKWNIKINGGTQYNFFVKYGRPLKIKNGYIQPYYENEFGEIQLIQKNPLGTHLGIHLGYKKNEKNIFYLGYEQSVNKGVYNLITQNNSKIIQDFSLRHIDNFFEILFSHSLNNKLNVAFGWYYLNSVQQEIIISEYYGFINLMERTGFNKFNNSYIGTFGGINLIFKTNKYFDWGVSSNVYFTIDTIEFESINFTTFINFKL